MVRGGRVGVLMAWITPIMVTTLRLCTELYRYLGMVPNESETLWRSWVNRLQLGNGCRQNLPRRRKNNLPKHNQKIILCGETVVNINLCRRWGNSIYAF